MKKYILFASAVVALAACSSNEEMEQIANCEINLSSTLLVQTRAAQDIQSTAFDSEQTVDVFISESTTGTASTTYKQPLKYTTGTGGSLTPEDTPYFPQNGNGVNIIGLYPSGLTTNIKDDAVAFSVKSDQSTNVNYKASDLMVGKPENGNPVARTTSSIALQFKHCLSKINVNIKAGAGVSADVLDGATVTIYTRTNDATFDVNREDVVTAVETQGQAASPFVTMGTLISSQNVFEGLSAIIIPQEIPAGSRFIMISITDGQSTTNYAYSLPTTENVIKFESGYAYTYNLTVTKSGLVVDSSTISNWQDYGDVFNGEATPIP